MRRALLATAALTLAVTGCTTVTGAASDTTTTQPGKNLVLKDGGTITVAVHSLPLQFNPWTPEGSTPVTAMVMQQVWPQPFVVNPQMQPVLANDTSGIPGSGLLTAEVVGVNPQTVVYSIAPKAAWSDGVPISATDFRYYWLHQLALGSRLPALVPLAGYQDIASIVGSNGGKTMTVTFKQPYADWQGLFTDLVPAHIARRYGWAAAFDRFDPAKVLSGGPFMITKVVPGKELVLGRNPHYWGHSPLISQIVFKVVRNDAAALAGLRSGRIDVAQLAPSPRVDAAVAASSHLDEQGGLSPELWQLGMNLADPVVGNPLVRQAIVNAVDRNQLVTNTAGLLTAYGQTAGNRVYASGAPGSQGNDGGYSSVDVSEAVQLLAQAGYPMGPDGKASLAGKPLVLHLVGPADDPIAANIEDELVAQLLQAGITVQVSNLPRRRLLESALPTGGYQLALLPYIVSAFPSTVAALYTRPVGPTPVVPTNTAAATTTTAAIPPTAPAPPGAVYVAGNETEPAAAASGGVSRDVLGYDDPEVTSLFAQASSQLNASAASSLYNRIDTRLWLDLPTLPLFQMPVELVTRLDLVNVSDTQTPVGPLWNAQDWAIQLSPPPTTTTLAP